MAPSTSLTHKQFPAVEKTRNWPLMLVSSMMSAAVSLGTVFAVAALTDPGAISMIAGTTAAGIVWGIMTKVFNDFIGSAVILHNYSLQQSYRKIIEQHLGAVLGDVMTSILTNTSFKQHNRIYFDVCDEYRFEDKQRHMFFDYSFEVSPAPRTPPRPLDEGIPPLDLPIYDPSSTHTIEDKQRTVKGTFSSIRQGTLLGLTSGASASLMSLLLGTVGIVLGVVLATMLVHHPEPPKRPERAALLNEFRIEMRCHLDRLLHCAKSNNIGLDADLCAASTSGMTSTWVGEPRLEMKPMARVCRRLSGRVVWSGETTEGGMRTRKERKPIADGTDESGKLMV